MYSKEEARTLRRDFWEGFGNYSKRLKHLRQQNKKWILYNTGIKHVELKFELDRNLVRVMLELNHRSESDRLEMFERLEKYGGIIEEICGDLTWDFLFVLPTGKEVCRVYTQSTEWDFYKRSQWPLLYEFMARNMIRLELAFQEIKDFIATGAAK